MHAVAVPIAVTGRGRRWAGVASVVAIAIVAASSTVLIRDLVSRAFPIVGGPLHVNVGVQGSATIGVRRPASIAVWLHNETGVAAVLDGISLLGASEHVRLLGARFFPTQTVGGFGVMHRFPPPARYRPQALAGGSIVDSHAHPAQAVVGIEVLRPGRYVFPGVVVDYHVGLTHYRAVILEGWMLCTPHVGPSADCRDLDVVEESQERLRALAFPEAD